MWRHVSIKRGIRTWERNEGRYRTWGGMCSTVYHFSWWLVPKKQLVSACAHAKAQLWYWTPCITDADRGGGASIGISENHVLAQNCKLGT